MHPTSIHLDPEPPRGRLLPRVHRPDGTPGIVLVPGELEIGLVVDAPEGARAVDGRDLARWSTAPEHLLPVALDNLRKRSNVASWYPLRAVPGMLVYLAGDGHAAARLLILRELLDPWPLGGVLVSVPTPDQLLVVPLDDLDHLTSLQVLVQSGHLAHQLGRDPVTEQVFWFDGREWSHVEVRRAEDSVEVLPPPRFLTMVERLASLKLSPRAGEA